MESYTRFYVEVLTQDGKWSRLDELQFLLPDTAMRHAQTYKRARVVARETTKRVILHWDHSKRMSGFEFNPEDTVYGERLIW